MLFLLIAVYLSASAAASPVSQKITEPKASLHLARSLNVSGHTLPDLDRLRASQIFKNGKRIQSHENEKRKRAPSSSFDVTNTAITYTADVQIGSPPTSYTLLIDTGSSNTWVGADKPYTQTSSSKATGNTVSVSYGSGGFSGYECKCMTFEGEH